MKRIRNLVIMLALALAMVGLVGAAKAEAAVATKFAYEIDYVNEIILIAPTDGTGDIYYAVVKADSTTAKPSALLKAEDGLIDISTIASTKASYVGILITDKVDLTARTVTLTGKVAINPGFSKLVIGFDFGVEGTDAGSFNDVISSITITKTGSDAATFKKEGTAYKNGTEEFSLENLQVKKGKNGSWEFVEESDTLDYYSAYKNSGTTLYFRAVSMASGEGTSASADTLAFAYSKEAKVKIPKTAKAPSVKADYTKGTVAIKNGMQFRNVEGDWFTVLPLAKSTASTTAIISESFKVGDTTDKTNKKSYLTIGELTEKLGIAASASGDAFNFEVRTAATDKKVASTAATLTLKNPVTLEKKSGITYTATTDSIKITIPDTAMNKKFSELQYVIVKGSDVGITEEGTTITNFDPVKTKWTTGTGTELEFTKETKIKIDKELSAVYYDASGNKKKVLPTDATYIIVRTPASKDDSLFPGIPYAIKLK